MFIALGGALEHMHRGNKHSLLDIVINKILKFIEIFTTVYIHKIAKFVILRIHNPYEFLLFCNVLVHYDRLLLWHKYYSTDLVINHQRSVRYPMLNL